MTPHRAVNEFRFRPCDGKTRDKTQTWILAAALRRKPRALRGGLRAQGAELLEHGLREVQHQRRVVHVHVQAVQHDVQRLRGPSMDETAKQSSTSKSRK